jgi:hypothetical protein
VIKLLDIIKEQDADKAASGPQKCGITTGLDKANSAADRAANKENRAWDKEVAKQNKIDAKDEAIKSKNFLSLNYDRNSDPLDKQSRRFYYSQYQKFITDNPSLLNSGDGFTTDQKYAIVSKIQSFLKGAPQISYSNRLNKKYGLNGQSTLNDVIGVVNQMGGFPSFMNWFNTGGIEIK